MGLHRGLLGANSTGRELNRSRVHGTVPFIGMSTPAEHTEQHPEQRTEQRTAAGHPNNGTPQNQQVPPRAPQQAPQNMIPQPRGPQGKKPRKPIDTIKQQKANIRTSLMLIVAALVILRRLPSCSPRCRFLGALHLRTRRHYPEHYCIVRTAVYRGPWFFYIAAGVSIIYGAITLLGGIGLALMPGARSTASAAPPR